jgi:hypothetical protein
MNVRRMEIGFVALAALMIAVSIYQLFLQPDLDHESNSSWQAWLSSLENTAKHRRADDLVWRDLHQGDRLSVGASVFTGQAARAQLSFREGHTLNLAANTLLRLQSKDTNELLLEQGVVQTTLSDQAIQLEMNGKKIQLSGAGARVQIVNDGDSTALSVMGGNAQLQDGDNKIQVATNEEVSVSADKETSKRKLSFKLLSPAEGAVIWSREASFVNFKWENPKNEQVVLEVARDLKFKDILQSQELTGTEASLRLVAGTLYWRIRSESGASRLATLNLRQEPELKLLNPEQDSIVSLPLETEKTWRLTLSWSPTEVKSYRVKWKAASSSGEAESAHYQLPMDFPVNEKITWSVGPNDRTRPEARSSIEQSFIIQSVPLPRKVEWSKDGPLDIFHGPEVTEADINWKGDALQYEWQVLSKDEIIRDGLQTSSGLVFPVLAAGKYFVKVRGVDQYGRKGEWSNSLLINWTPFEKRQPIEGQKIVLKRPDQKITFSWSGEGEQIFELARDEEFKDVILTQNGDGKTEIVFPQVGTFFWRARYIDATGKTNYSAPKKVMVEPTPPLATPEALPSIKKEIEIRFIKPKTTWIDWLIPSAFADNYETSVTLQLPENETAVGYKVEIYSDEELKNKVFSMATSKTEFEWKGARPGRYWWRYSLVDAWGRETAMSQASELDLIPGEARNPGKPKMLRPIRSVQLPESPEVNFAWTPSERTFDYQLEVSKDDDFEENLVFEETTKTQSFLKTDNWPRGEEIFWRVKARHKWGETISNTGRFVLGNKKVLTPEEVKALPWRKALAYGWLRVGFEPRTMSIELDDREFNGKIEGTAMNSLSLATRLQGKRWSFFGQYLRQSGSVFDGEPFTRSDLTLAGERHWRMSENSFIWAGLGASRISQSNYRLRTPEAIEMDEEISLLAPRIHNELEWRWGEKTSGHLNLVGSFGDWTSIEAQLNVRRFWRLGGFYEIGLSSEQATLKATRGDNKYSSMGVNARMGFSF